VTRRRFLRRAGIVVGGAVAVAGGGLVVRAWQEGALGSLEAGPAFDAWRRWERARPPGPLALVAAAILASNPHNSQPWLFRIAPGRLELFADRTRHLGSIDPFRREMHLGLGCAIENMTVAARGLGYRAEVSLQPDRAREDLVARLALSAAPPQMGGHFDAIARRHTNRGAYDRGRPLAPAARAALMALATHPDTRLVLLDADGADGRLFASGTVQATEQFVADPELSADSLRWFRHSLADVNRHRDGVTTLAAGLPASLLRLALAAPVRWIGDPGRAWLAATRDRHCATAPTFGLVAVRNPADPVQRLEAGRLWQRLHLEAVGHGVAMQPLNQLMELAERDRVLGRDSDAARTLARLSGDGFHTVFGFRAGYASAAAPAAPRRSLESVLLT
jgi:hypothetical protein